jgi:hypothetical protein
MLLAFVLLGSPTAPRATLVHEALLAWGLDAGPADGNDESLSFTTDFGTLFVAYMPAPIPEGEADSAARYSLGAFGTEAKWRPHVAHLTVALAGIEGKASIETVTCFTRAVAAVAQAAEAYGVYWGSGNVAHDAAFFISGAEEEVPLLLWSGVSIARGASEVSLLTTGLRQFGVPELMVVAKPGAGNEALAYLFDLGGYVVQRGEAIPDGDTVGRTAEEKMRVEYQVSPFNEAEQVAVVRLP